MRAQYLADKSALARFVLPVVASRVRPALEEGLIATCALVDLEILYSGRSLADYEALREERAALDDVPITSLVLERALDVQHELARTGHHRVAIPELIIAAAAESAHLTVLHYNADFERIAGVTGQAHEWVGPRGEL